MRCRNNATALCTADTVAAEVTRLTSYAVERSAPTYVVDYDHVALGHCNGLGVRPGSFDSGPASISRMAATLASSSSAARTNCAPEADAK